VHQWLWEVCNEPLGVWFYLLTLVSGMLGTLIVGGRTPGALMGGLIGAAMVLGVVCGLRRLIVGRWG